MTQLAPPPPPDLRSSAWTAAAFMGRLLIGLVVFLVLGARLTSSPSVVVLDHRDEEPRAAATSITPITSTGDAASGLAFSGDAYDITCTVSTDTVTLTAAAHDGTAWRIFDATTQTLAVGAGRTVRFPADRQIGLVWNALKAGGGSVASCTARQSYGPVTRPGGGGGSAPAAHASSHESGGADALDLALLAGTLGTANGGTGLTGFTANRVFYSSSTSAIGQLGCADGQVVTWSSGALTCTTPAAGGNAIYGDGSDGPIDLDGVNTYAFLTKVGIDYTQARDIYPTTLIVRAGSTLTTASFRTYGQTSCAVENGAWIGNPGKAAAGTSAGGAVGSAVFPSSGPGGGGSTMGGGGGSGPGTFSAIGGNGGNGGSGSSGSGGTGASASVLNANLGSFRSLPAIQLGAVFGAQGIDSPGWTLLGVGSGGGGGGGDGSNSGGGGGGGGGATSIACKALTVAGAGAIRADGGAGAPGTAGNSGGGGGGGGGWAGVVYGSCTGCSGTTLTAAGGAGGSGTGTGTPGNNGVAGVVVELVN